MGHLSLAFLGSPEVRHAGQPLTFPTRKSLALLVYLVVDGGMHAREKLTTLLWPDSNSARGRGSLRLTLTYLRNTLRDPHLVVEHDALGFDFASDFDLDLHTLDASTQIARGTMPEPARLPAAIAQLQSAVDAYRGDFLEGFSLSDAPDFDDWASLQREVCHRQASEILERLSQLQFEGGALVEAINTTRHWIAHDPLHEAAHRRLMQLYFAAGNRAAALQAYEACRAVLVAQLAAEPAPETEELATRIRAEMPPRSRPARRWREPDSPVTALEAPLTGRAAAHAELVNAFYAASRGQAQAVALVGEAGIGKTRLATEFLTWAAAQGVDILQGRAFETGSRMPYQPVVEALRSRLSLEGTHPLDLSRSIAPIWLAELGLLLPEVYEQYPGLPARLPDETAAQARLFEAVARLGQALAEQAPLILFIDDVQWADAASLDLLYYSARRWSHNRLPVLLVLAVRAETWVAASGLAGWLASIERDMVLTRLTLGPLTAEDTLHLVQLLASGEPDVEQLAIDEGSAVRQFSLWLFAETRGQPFFIVETLKILLERNVLVTRLGRDGRRVIGFDAAVGGETKLRSLIPPRVQDLIHARLASLAPAGLALLTAGAILGHSFNFERLCQVAGLSEDDGLPALDVLLNSHLLQPMEREPERQPDPIYSFTHDKIRDVVYAEAGEPRRRVYHRRAFEALQSAQVSPAELAHHALESGLIDQAFRFSLVAGDEALRLYAVSDAIAHYERARRLSVGELSIRLPASDFGYLYTQLGSAYQLANDFDNARAVYRALLALAQEAHDPRLECAALNRLATVEAQDAVNLQTAEALLNQALKVAASSDDKVGWAEAEWNLAQVRTYAFDAEASLAHGMRALALARELGWQELIARSLNVITYAELALNRVEQAKVHAEESRTHYAELGNRTLEADGLCLGAMAALRLGQPRAGIDLARAALAISQEIDNAWGQVHASVHLVSNLLDAGEYEEALKVARRGVTIGREHQMTHLHVLILVKLGEVHRALLDLEAARAAHRNALAIGESLPPPFKSMIAAELCADCVLVGLWPEAYTYALHALAHREYNILPAGFQCWPEAEALAHAGEVERAVQDVRILGEGLGDCRRYRVPYLRGLAILARSRGEIEQAINHLKVVAALAEEIGLPGELWQIQAVLGTVYRERGDARAARLAFTRSTQLIQSLAAKFEDERLRSSFLSARLAQQVLTESANL